jgi:type I restriction enzyme S subunit
MSAQLHKRLQDDVPEFKMKWPKVSLREVLQPVSRPEIIAPDVTYKILGAHWYAKGLYTKDIKSGSQIQAKHVYRIEEGDFVYNRLFAWKGSFAVATSENHGCYVSNEFPCFTVNNNIAESTYLWKYFSRVSIWYEALSLSSGGTPTSRNRLREEKLLSMKIPLPPLSEQQRIVAKIEELARKIEEAHRLRLQAVREAETIILLSIDNICFKSDFPLCSLGEVLVEAKNGIYKPPEFWGYGIPCIRMYNIEGPGMNINQLKLLDVTPEEFDSYGCRPGDLIFNRVNSAELVGKTGLLTEDYPLCTFESKNMRLRVDNNKSLSEYTAIVLNSKKIRDYYRSSLKQQCGMATLNQNHVRAIPLPLPTLSEQRRIVEYLDNLQSKIDKLKELQSETQKELDALMPSILDKAFKGKL